MHPSPTTVSRWFSLTRGWSDTKSGREAASKKKEAHTGGCATTMPSSAVRPGSYSATAT